MQGQDWLKRIGLHDTSDFRPTKEWLLRIGRAHLVSVPFENLDLHFGRNVTAQLAPTWDKIVRQRRGGWCHEHIMVAEQALRDLGYGVRRGTGQVAVGEDAWTPPGTHAFLLVECEGEGEGEGEGDRGGSDHEDQEQEDGKDKEKRDIDERKTEPRVFLFDVGFPKAALEPLCVSPGSMGTEQVVPQDDTHRIIETSDGQYYQFETKEPTGSWRTNWRWRHYQPNLDVHIYDQGNDWVKGGDDTPFKIGILVSRRTHDGGRVTITGNTKKVTAPDGTKTLSELTEGEVVEALQDLFGLEIPNIFGERDVKSSPLIDFC